MTIQFNTDKNISGSDRLTSPLIVLLTEGLCKYSSQITRLEVHLTDENGRKEAVNDKRCMTEARLEGRQPIAVIHHADNHEQAIAGAIEKLNTMLNSTLGRLKTH